MVGVFVAFIRVVYGRMIYMSLPIYSYTNDDDTCKKTNVNIYKDCPMFSEQMLTSLTKP